MSRALWPSSASVGPIKCVVWDLDGTVWSGTLAVGDRVALRQSAVAIIEQMDARGVLQSIASKNEFDIAWAKLREFGLSSYFLAPQISWRPKSDSLRNISHLLGLGLASFAFVDDEV